jgi:hypothetical protein
MTFAIMKIKGENQRVVGTLWTNDENQARSLATDLCKCSDGEQLRICLTEDREIPFRVAERYPACLY